jgi:hypothetical protein
LIINQADNMATKNAVNASNIDVATEIEIQQAMIVLMIIALFCSLMMR